MSNLVWIVGMSPFSSPEYQTKSGGRDAVFQGHRVS